MKKNVNDANVREFTATYGEFAQVWRVVKNFIDDVDRNLALGSVPYNQMNMIIEEKNNLLNKANDLVVKIETLGSSILNEIGSTFDDETRQTQLLVLDYLEAAPIKEFKAVYEANSSESEPNA